MNIYNEWLLYAEYDLKAAQILFDSDTIALPPIVFHIQQAIEKSLKAFLVFHNIKPQRSHDLAFLINQCSEFDTGFAIYLDKVVPINPFITVGRYPDTMFALPDETTVRIDLKIAIEILNFVKNKLNN